MSHSAGMLDALDALGSSRQQRKVTKARGKAAVRHTNAQGKAATRKSKANRKASKAETKASKAAAKASKAAAATASTRPARAIDKMTDPKVAKRAVTMGTIITPALAPTVLKVAARTRGALDRNRAHRLGVPLSRVAHYRGPTGPVMARLDGLSRSVDKLASRTGNAQDIQAFTASATRRLANLRDTVEAAASMPRAYRSEVLRTVGAELDTVDSDVVAHLLTPGY